MRASHMRRLAEKILEANCECECELCARRGSAFVRVQDFEMHFGAVAQAQQRQCPVLLSQHTPAKRDLKPAAVWRVALVLAEIGWSRMSRHCGAERRTVAQVLKCFVLRIMR